jgi:hypothetical protein
MEAAPAVMRVTPKQNWLFCAPPAMLMAAIHECL